MDEWTKLSYTLNGKRHTYIRPSQARDIPMKSGSNRGYMPSQKDHLERELGRKVVLESESLLEHDNLLLLDQDGHCIDLQPQPVELEYTSASGNVVKFYPDCWAIFDDGREFLFDVKRDAEWQKKLGEEKWKLRQEATREFCKKVGWTYQIVTEKKIRCVRLPDPAAVDPAGDLGRAVHQRRA